MQIACPTGFIFTDANKNFSFFAFQIYFWQAVNFASHLALFFFAISFSSDGAYFLIILKSSFTSAPLIDRFMFPVPSWKSYFAGAYIRVSCPCMKVPFDTATFAVIVISLLLSEGIIF